MKTRTKLEVKSQRPKRYIKRDAGIVSANASQPRAGLLEESGRTDAEPEKEK